LWGVGGHFDIFLLGRLIVVVDHQLRGMIANFLVWIIGL